MDYLQITLNGFANPTTRKFLSEYFKREFIKAKEKHFEHLEFFEGCLLIINSFKEEIDRKYYDRKRELSLILSIRKENSKETADIQEEINTLNKDLFSINLHQVTRGNYIGDLGYTDINKIEIALREAYILIIKNLIGEFETPFVQQNFDENIDTNITSYQHSHIFKNNSFTIWEKFFEHLEVNESKRTDMRFIFEVMKRDELIHSTITVKNIQDWICETYEFALDKLQFTNINDASNKKRMKDYLKIKSENK